MPAYKWIRKPLVYFLITQVLLLVSVLAVVSAASQEPVGQMAREPVTARHSEAPSYRAANGLFPAVTEDVAFSVGAQSFRPLAQASPTSLQVAIVSSPWATLDHNNPVGIGEEVPNVFVVEAVITNTGTTTATGVAVALDYNEDLANNWILLAGEDPNRSLGELAAGAAYHAYWFARYSTSIGASHQYTVTALADNASSVATSDNFYGNPEPGKTVKTRGVASTGNAGVSSMGEVVVGAASTVTVEYDLGNNPLEAALSPVGNPDFDPATYRLLASEVRFYDDAEAQEILVSERLYFPTVPAFAQNATATFTFIAFKSTVTRMCSYAAVDYQSTAKYDQFYCRDDKDTIVPISGTLTLSMTKEASSPTIQQNQRLTYTIQYTNHGNLPLAYVWVWDDVSTSTGSIIPDSIDPPSNADETSESRVAWFLGDVAAWGQPGSTGTLTFTILVDGNHQDLADKSLLVNHALFGIRQGSLPEEPALSSTITTTLQAPVIFIGKTDGQDTAEAGERLTYTLRITNSGSVTATGLMITDLLPVEGDYVSRTANPPETNRTKQTLLWENLAPIPPGGGKLVITVPVSIGLRVANGTVLTNTMRVSYQNPAGWVFDTMAVTDTTTVHAPILTISKHDSPDPVLAGHLVTYTLHYTNHGSAAATGVLITDVVPMSTTYQSCSGGSACWLESDVVRWTIGSVPGGAGGAVTFSVAVSDSLRSGALIHNEEYGISAEQTGFVSGPLVTTRVDRSAAFFEGYTFIDANGDGVYEPGSEGSLPGVTVTLASATEPITTTDSNGYYRLRVESAGAMSVTAALPPGYFRTTPSTVYTDSVFGITQTVNFGYAPDSSAFGVIYGTVFEDADHNANRDTGEQGLAGVTITSHEAAISPSSTNGYGQYTLRYDMSGPVTVTETNPPPYVSTTPDAVHANAVTGSSGPSPIDFGDFAGIRITGQVFDDINVNGVKDGEPGVSGATVAAGEDSFTTTSSGVYTLYVTLNESVPVLIDEMDPVGYVSTNAVPSSAMSKVNANTQY